MQKLWDDWYDSKPWALGSAFAVNQESPEYEQVERLRDVVEEITRKPVERPTRKIGFY